MMWLSKLRPVAMALLLVVAVSAGVALTLRSGLAAPDAPPGAAAKVDRHGDPLPEGAVLRLGTLKQRAVGASLAFAADGKTIIGVRGGKYVSVWDAETGKLREKRELPGEGRGRVRLSTDGRWLATEAWAGEGVVTVWDMQSG
jgi:hypothetical protein